MLPLILAIADESDQQFVANIYTRYAKKLFLVANNILQHHEDSEDCVHDVFITLINVLEPFKTWSELHQINFLVKCCRSAAIDRYREKKRQCEKEFSLSDEETGETIDIVDESASLTEMIITEENIKELTKMILELDPKYRDILYLRFIAQMEPQEIAKALGITPNLVNNRVLRARRMLLKRREEANNG